jgi:DNA polymerase I-like protein with 3'-5' exonuclease and polymerase domains
MRLLFDIETNAVDFDSNVYFLDQIHTVLCMVALDVDTKNLYKFYDTDGLRELGTANIEAGIKLLEQADEWIGHNIIAFDIPVLEKLFGIARAPRILDTLVVSRLLYTDRSGGHSLESYGERLGFAKLEAPGFTEFTPGLLTYCVRDVELNARVLSLLESELNNWDWSKAVQLEHRIADIMFKQEQRGFAFDTPKAIALIEKMESEVSQIDQELNSLLGSRVIARGEVPKPFRIDGSLGARVLDWCARYQLDPSLIAGPFQFIEYVHYNYESPPQQKQILLSLGWKPENRTEAGQPKIDDSATQVGPVGSHLLRRNVVSHKRSQVQGWINRVDSSGRIHGGANPCGTNTHRMRHKVVVNVPRVTSEFGKDMRGLFVAPSGKILGGYDAKQLELRMLAHYLGDQDYVERVTTRDKSRDAHVLAANAAGSGDRDLGKGINYALIYGAGDKRLGSLVGGGADRGAGIRAELYRLIPGLERLVRASKTAAQRGYLIGLDGRKHYIRQAIASPLNTLIQGGGAVYMKKVTEILDQYINQEYWYKVLDMHDEAQWEIFDTDAAKKIFELQVGNAFDLANKFYGLRCPQEPDVKFGYTWAETH